MLAGTRYLTVFITLAFAVIAFASCTQKPIPAPAPAPAPKPAPRPIKKTSPAPEVITALSTTPAPETAEEEYYSTIGEKLTKIAGGAPEKPDVIVIEEQGEFETIEEYNTRKGETLEKQKKEEEEWETDVLKYYKNNEEDFLVVVDEVNIGRYDISNGLYHFQVHHRSYMFPAIFFPPEMYVSADSNGMDIDFDVKVSVEKGQEIREQTQRGALNIVMNVHFVFFDEQFHTGEKTEVRSRDTILYITWVTLNNIDAKLSFPLHRQRLKDCFLHEGESYC